uniref:hypothetical protein n=1 Tax=Cutibacterium acnes TaxID=1747 RepID=UPI00254F6CBE
NRVGVQWWAYTAGDPTTAGPGTEQALVDDPARPPQGTNVESASLTPSTLIPSVMTTRRCTSVTQRH